MIICKICEKEFKDIKGLSIHIKKSHKIDKKDYYDIFFRDYNNREGICKQCYKENKFIGLGFGYREFCSVKCSSSNIETRNKIEKTSLIKYGVDRPQKSKQVKEKTKKTNLLKYGTKSSFQNKTVQNKFKENNLKKYGVENPNKLNSVRDKINKTNISKYGVENPFQSEKIKQKIKKINLKRYGVEHPSQSKEIKEKKRNNKLDKYYKKLLENKYIKPLFCREEYYGSKKLYDKNYEFECRKCGKKIIVKLDFSWLPICRDCYPLNHGSSKSEKEMQSWLSSYIHIESNKKFYNDSQRYELDIFIPSLNLGIEFNGLYWHSELAGKNKNYHINKTNWFKKNYGINIIHIFENEWLFKQDIIKSIILNKIGKTPHKIYARKCIIKEVNFKQYNNFLEENHLIGKDNSKIRLGLFYNNELVSVIGFKKPRFNNEYQIEYSLSRFCSKLNTLIVGGFSKLLKYFKLNFSSSIITYADIRYSNGELYLRNGFEMNHQSKPNYYYFNNNFELYHRINFQRKYLEEKLDFFDPNLTEWENMQMNGWNRIWDCGNFVLTYEV